MQPKYKKIKQLVPTCPECKQQLQGDNSIISPYKCDCGTWKYIGIGKGFKILK